MWATLAVASALSLAPAQSGKLEIKNDRATYGVFGQERKEATILAGDIYFLSFDIEGLQVKDDGRVKYSMGMKLIDSAKKEVFVKEPQELEATTGLGGSRQPAFALSEIGTETAPGKYTMKVTIVDLVDKKNPTTTLSREFEVVAKKFGFVRVGLTTVPVGQNGDTLPVPPLQVTGQTILVNFALVGFDIDDKTMQPDLAVEMRVLDKDGKPTRAKPFTGEANKDIPRGFTKLLPMQFILPLNQAGTYTLELEATDKKGTKKMAKQTLTLTVMDLPK
jgi:hypothetical protein